MSAVVRVPTDAYGRMRVDQLDAMLSEMRADSAHPHGMPLLVNATSGTTVMGAFDDLGAIADVCARHGCWMHVDASWGGPVAFSDTERLRLAGIERSDSVTINPHKLLTVTHQCSFLLVRRRRSLATLVIEAGYLFHGPSHDLAIKTLGCGRRGDALKFYLVWLRYGTAGLGAHIASGMEMAKRVLQRVRAEPSLEVGPLAEPLFLQICFRPAMGSAAAASAAARRLHDTFAARRHYAVDFAPLPSGDYLRFVRRPPADTDWSCTRGQRKRCFTQLWRRPPLGQPRGATNRRWAPTLQNSTQHSMIPDIN
jgi:hypothetical protein